ncbi:PAS domain-containing hybrid sensor histidine kinase/response regulator [Cochlodiniinecator piscidefendens]|uniref:PAS domain-containing hybrid sensor histidine kinase/response regulator n=1 Tax=Cochlodiniinecator piscidefendens TaxID=2715756 RepID=UPI001E37DA79|nr:PAS domain-containing hybrid sensor histidine kinase/response regulator [Cochlodiniinecator piscidefendens]
MSEQISNLPPKMKSIGVLSALLFALSAVAPSELLKLGFLAAGASSLIVLLSTLLLSRGKEQKGKAAVQQYENLVMDDLSKCLITDGDGEVLFKNTRAKGQNTPTSLPQSMASYLSFSVAGAFELAPRLLERAKSVGNAQEHLQLRRVPARISVHKIEKNRFLWRLEEELDHKEINRNSDGISLPMLTASANGSILFMNDAMRRLIGSRERTLDRVFPDLPIKTGQKNRVSGADGVLNSVVSVIEGAAGRQEIYLVPNIALTDSQHSSPSVFEKLPVALMEIAPNGIVQKANQRARDLLGEFEGDTAALSELVEGLGRSIRDWVDDAFQGRGSQHSEVIKARREDAEVFVQITLARVIDDEKTRLYAVLTDATELKSIEAQFVQSQKMQAIGQLAGGVAHDFNNLLTAITGHCDLLLMRHDQGDPDFSDLTQINENANRAASLVGQLLAFSRKQTLQPEVVDIRETLSDLTHLLNRLVGEKVTLALNHSRDLPNVKADKGQLEQIIMNLVVNARDAMPEGGEIDIETTHEHLNRPLFRDRVEVPVGDYTCIRVKDQGHGIPEDKRAIIFEPFYTTKRAGEGTGLGLSMVYGIIKQSGAFIFVDSAIGTGTVFTLYFPSCSEEATAAPKPRLEKPIERNDAASGVVMLVEDEAPVRAFASRALRMRGYTVLEADCAEAALETLEDSDLQVDLFLTDVIMPGMDGPSWVKQALQQRPETKVIFVSGYAEDVFNEEGMLPNAVFLPKPFSLKELTKTVQTQITRPN